ncbi:zinc-binding dehydrogenase [Streptomyces radicis]|uniref:zinc-binding dehydrogenase n=1 Tax=Streptomyces radicis TaxID=1750517 RepID=UPI002E32430C|nr:zinc-binding dehydrogenase [Streptomyces radicis]
MVFEEFGGELAVREVPGSGGAARWGGGAGGGDAAVSERLAWVDGAPGALEVARRLGAEVCVGGAEADGSSGGVVREVTGGGTHLSLDAFGSEAACAASLEGLRPRGRHVQVGLLPSGAWVPMDRVVALDPKSWAAMAWLLTPTRR